MKRGQWTGIQRTGIFFVTGMSGEYIGRKIAQQKAQKILESLPADSQLRQLLKGQPVPQAPSSWDTHRVNTEWDKIRQDRPETEVQYNKYGDRID